MEFGQLVGNPLPDKVTFPPLVDKEEGVAEEKDDSTLSRYALVYPIGSILALTL